MFIEQRMNLEKKIIIYGAGDYGKRLLDYLADKGYSVFGFCETEKTRDEVWGVRVFEAKELEIFPANEFIILIAVANLNLSRELKQNIISISNDFDVYEMGKVISGNFGLVDDSDEHGKKIELNYRCYNDMSNLIRKRFHLLPEVDCIVAIPRSGLIPATEIGLLLNKPVLTLNEFLHKNIDAIECKYSERICGKDFSEIKRVLVVDDSCGSGKRISKVKTEIRKCYSNSDLKTIYTCIYVTENSKQYVDFFFEICEFPRVFEWNVMNHPILTNSAIDLDGVLCIDPTDDQNDDGKNYIEFIKNATPLYKPNYEIGAIVTSRLKKYRKETERWLKENGIKYQELIMLDLPDKKTRVRFNAHASFKADVYGKGKWELFIESNVAQADAIQKKTNRPVLCVEDMALRNPEDKQVFYEKFIEYSFNVKSEAKRIIESMSALREKILEENNDTLMKSFIQNVIELRNVMREYSLYDSILKKIDTLELELIENDNIDECMKVIKKTNMNSLSHMIESVINQYVIEMLNRDI